VRVSDREGLRGRGDRIGLAVIASIAIMPMLAGCSAFSSSSTSAAPPAGSVPGYPSQSISDLFRSDSPPATQAAAAPRPPGTYYPADGAPVAGQPAAAAAAPAASYAGVYPGQNLFQFGSDSPPQPQSAAPRPPSTYYPANGAPVPGQTAGASAAAPPYTPSSQQAAAGAPPPAATDTASNGVYPSQSLFDLFKKNSNGQ